MLCFDDIWLHCVSMPWPYLSNTCLESLYNIGICRTTCSKQTLKKPLMSKIWIRSGPPLWILDHHRLCCLVFSLNRLLAQVTLTKTKMLQHLYVLLSLTTCSLACILVPRVVQQALQHQKYLSQCVAIVATHKCVSGWTVLHACRLQHHHAFLLCRSCHLRSQVVFSNWGQV